MHELRSDRAKNRIYMRAWGVTSPAEVQACADELIAEARYLRPGFTLITDLREFKPMVQEAVAELMRLQTALVKAGMSRAVRISSPELSLTSVQFERARREAKLSYEVIFVDSLEEADQLLG
jgi:hypothetical protein